MTFTFKKCELVHNATELRRLNMEMVKDYTTKVHIIRGDKKSPKFILELSNYIVKNISKKITVKNVTKNFYISKTSLASKIKEETGMTLIDFINYKKIEVSKDLLKNSTNSIIEVSDYLGFYSQSVFNKVFKKYTQKTPLEFRKENSKNI